MSKAEPLPTPLEMERQRFEDNMSVAEFAVVRMVLENVLFIEDPKDPKKKESKLKAAHAELVHLQLLNRFADILKAKN